VSQLQESLTNAADEALERPTIVCKDCKSPSPIDSLIEVDALHVQCPQCLFVFFLDTAQL
jgi:Zn finger protein HypA/HybF involved in hydrogenase expression